MSRGGDLLVIEAVSMRFGGLTAVDNLTIRVARGEICGVIGPNGAGKTTLFNMIAGDLTPSEGAILLEGTKISGLPSYEVARRGVARTFQLVHMFNSMTVADNVLVGAEEHGKMRLLSAFTHLGGFRARQSAARERAAAALATIGAGHLAGRNVATLSIGQQRLVAVARALAGRPKIVLLDEPAAGLTKGEIDGLVVAIRRARDAGVTILLVEHNVGLVMSLCEHVVALNFGAKIADGDPGSVRASKAVMEAYLGR